MAADFMRICHALNLCMAGLKASIFGTRASNCFNPRAVMNSLAELSILKGFKVGRPLTKAAA